MRLFFGDGLDVDTGDGLTRIGSSGWRRWPKTSRVELLIPISIGVSLGAAFVIGLFLSLVRSSRVVLLLCQSTLLLQAAIVVTAWALIATLPREMNDRGHECIDFDSVGGDVLAVLAWGAIPVGAAAQAAAVLSADVLPEACT